eukprot:1309292-Pyramimonas_sp.AAC.1
MLKPGLADARRWIGTVEEMCVGKEVRQRQIEIEKEGERPKNKRAREKESKRNNHRERESGRVQSE